MSGIEIVGVVASTLQIAEIGMKLSVKLCSFYRQIKDADQSAQRLSSDVSLTCSILHQLGKALEQDKDTKLCSQQALLTAQEVLRECKKIFKQIEETIEKKDPGSGKNKWKRGTRRLTIVLLGPDLDVLNSHLDRLKSTMLLMLNVIMYARELNRSSDHSSLDDQRKLIQTLLQEKKENDTRLEKLIKVAESRSNGENNDIFPSATLIAQPDVRASQQPSPDSEIDKYHKLVETLLCEIDVYQSSLQQDRHIRIRDGMVNVHMAELAIFHQSHGSTAVQVFDSPFFKLRNQNLDSCSGSKLYNISSTQKAEPVSWRNSTRPISGLDRDQSLRRRPMLLIRRASTGTLNLESIYRSPREHYDQAFSRRIRDHHPSSRRLGHRRIYSTDYASETGRLGSRDDFKHGMGHGAYRVHPLPASARYSAYDRLRKGDGIDCIDAHSYTTPREQFDRDYPIKARSRGPRYSSDRPLSITGTEDNPQWLAGKDRPHGPPPTAWGLDKVGRERSMRNRDEPQDSHRLKDGIHGQALVTLPHDSDGEYPSRHERRRHRRPHPEVHHFKSYDGDALAAMGLGTAALEDGYSDVSDYEHRRSIRTHIRMHDERDKRDQDAVQSLTQELVEANTSAERSKQTYGDLAKVHRQGRSRRYFQRRVHSDDGDTSDDDLRKYRSDSTQRRHNSTDISHSDRGRSDARTPRHYRREQDHSHGYYSSHSHHRMLADGHSNKTRQSPPFDIIEDDVLRPAVVDPPGTKEPEAPPKGIIKAPRPAFPEEPTPVSEGVAPLKDANKQGIPPGARWTKIDRRLVNGDALKIGNEQFKERSDHVIVLRILSKEEIKAYAVKTQQIRDTRHKNHFRAKRKIRDETHHFGRRGEESSSDDEYEESIGIYSDETSAEVDDPGRYDRSTPKVYSSLSPTKSDESVRLYPWYNPLRDSTPRTHAIQPDSSTDAMIAFEKRVRDLETASLTATVDNNSIFNVTTSLENLSFGNREQPKKRTSLFKRPFLQASSILKRQASDMSIGQSSTYPGLQRDTEDSQVKQSHSPRNPFSSRRHSRSPSLSNAPMAMPSQIASVSGSQSVPAVSPAPSPNPERSSLNLSQYTGRGRSRSDIGTWLRDPSINLETPPIKGATKESDFEKQVAHFGEKDVSDNTAMDTLESLVQCWTTLRI